MNPVLFTFGSLTGNTEILTATLTDNLKAQLPNFDTDLVNVRDLSSELILKYRTIVFGVSSWDDGLNPDTIDFVNSLKIEKPNFSNQTFALFGLGDSYYPEFCPALRILKTELENYGAKVHPEIFTIDGFPTEQHQTELLAWAIRTIDLLYSPASGQ